MASPTPRALLGLSALGFVLLWGVMLANGTLDGISQVVAKGQFPNGRSLRKVYTGYPVMDDNLATVVAFFDLLASTRAKAPRWLFFLLCNVLGAVDSWVLIESRRRGVRNLFLRQ